MPLVCYPTVDFAAPASLINEDLLSTSEMSFARGFTLFTQGHESYTFESVNYAAHLKLLLKAVDDFMRYRTACKKNMNSKPSQCNAIHDTFRTVDEALAEHEKQSLPLVLILGDSATGEKYAHMIPDVYRFWESPFPHSVPILEAVRVIKASRNGNHWQNNGTGMSSVDWAMTAVALCAFEQQLDMYFSSFKQTYIRQKLAEIQDGDSDHNHDNDDSEYQQDRGC